jgi:hypothetical protein
VNDFGAGALHDAAHDVDSGVMSVEKGGGGYDTDFILRLVRRNLFHTLDLFGLVFKSFGLFCMPVEFWGMARWRDMQPKNKRCRDNPAFL